MRLFDADRADRAGEEERSIIGLMTQNSNWRPVALSLTVLGAIVRLLPHPPNFAPVGATSLFAGARLPVWQAYLVPLALMAITDPIVASVLQLLPEKLTENHTLKQ